MLVWLLAVAPPAVAQTAPDPGDLCRAAVAVAEREFGLPSRLLAALARVESGRRDAETGQVNPWPWTINAEGRGSIYPTKAAAIAAVQALQGQGVQSIDVGCMQINLRHHPNAFASLEDGFDPLTNARYGARFLTELQATRQDWMVSAGHYHSQTPERAEAYRGAVAGAWNAERQGPGAPGADVLAAAGGGGGARLSNGAERTAVVPAAPGAAPGRGLDAYRAAPIALAYRMPLGLGRTSRF